jgi:hypothetical protein
VTTPPTEPQEQHDRLRADGERELSVWRIAEDLMRQSPGSTFEFPDAPQGQHIALVRYVADRLAADATKQRDAELEQLRAENERLRVEVERLRARLDWATPDKEPFDASKNAFFSMRSDLRLDGCSTLSLHRVGVDVHLRVQHHGVDHYAVAVLQPGDVRSLAQALAPRPSLPAEATPDSHALALAREVLDEHDAGRSPLPSTVCELAARVLRLASGVPTPAPEPHAANANRDPSDEWCRRCDEHLNSDVHAVDAQPGDRVRGTGVQTGITRVGVFDGTRSIPTGDSALIHLDSGLPAWVLVDSVEVVSRKEQQA